MATGREPVHPAANIFPMMPSEELQRLADDIRDNGQREPIVYFQGKLLDGRNRLAACKLAQVEPDTCEIDEEDLHGNKFDPVAYVLSTNLRRRHLTESQRAMIGLEVEKYHAAAAKERQREAGRKRGRGAEKVVATVPQAIEPSRARDKAATAVGVSPRLVSHAKRVQHDGAPELVAAVNGGRVSVTVAAKLAKAVPDKQRQAAAVQEALACNTNRQTDAVLNRAISAAPWQTTPKDCDEEPSPFNLESFGIAERKARDAFCKAFSGWPEEWWPDINAVLQELMEEDKSQW